MKLSILGDSISTFANFIPKTCETCYPKKDSDVDSPEKTWWALLCRALNLELECNQSYSGARISPSGLEAHPIQSCFSSYNRWGYLGNPDLIILFGGTNDYGSSVNPSSRDFFRSSYRSLLFNLRCKYPGARIYCCTPLKRLDRPFNQVNENGLDFLSLCSIIKEEAQDQDIEVADLAGLDYTEEDGILCDGLHPTYKGMQLIEKVLEKAIRRTL